MKYSVIDIGSNTIRLHLYHYDGEKITSMMNKKTVAGLSSYVKNGFLTEGGIKKLLKVLKKYKDLIKALEIDRNYIFATAAIRNASNSEEVVQEVKNKLDLDVEILSGSDEANYGYLAIRQDYSFKTGAIIDIGGGSTEITLLKDEKILFKTSIKEGSLSLHTKFVSKILPTNEEIRKMRKYVKELIDDENIPIHSSYNIYGIGGTIRSCGNISQEYFNLYSSKSLNAEVVFELQKKLVKRKKRALRTVLQVSPERVHTIIPGMLIFCELIERLKTEKIYISDNGLREGYLSSMIDSAEKVMR